MDQPTVDAVLEDHRTAPIREPLRLVLDVLQTLTLTPQELGPADIEPLLDAGLSKQAIYDAMYVAFCFNVIDRLADAFDYETYDAKHQRRTVAFLRWFGYWAAALPS